MAENAVSLAYADGTGSFLVLLAIAEQEALFQKYGLKVRSVGIKGAAVPRLTRDMPLGMIGEPAVLLQATEGADLLPSRFFQRRQALRPSRCPARDQRTRRFARQAAGSARGCAGPLMQLAVNRRQHPHRTLMSRGTRAKHVFCCRCSRLKMALTPPQPIQSQGSENSYFPKYREWLC